MDEFVTFAALLAIATHVTSLIKFLSAGQVRQFVTGMLPMVGLFGVLVLAAQADAMADLPIPGLDVPLGRLDIPSLLLVAIAGGSGGAQVFNYRKAVDNTDSAVEPMLLAGRRPEL